jgi:TolB-like protein/Tfp pilus assembly protein PilF
MIELFKELRRRKVWLFGGIYLAMAWVLLEVSMALEETLALPNWVDQITLVLLGLGFPVVILLAWAQESIAPVADKSEKDGEASTAGVAPDGRNRPSLVILPFNCFSDDRDIEILADGMTEDLTTLMGRIPDMFVIARNTAFSYKGKTPNLRDVGQELGVRYVLEGSFRKLGENVRISPQLIETQTGTHLWAESYDRPLADFLSIQDELAQTLAMQLCSEVIRAEAALAKQVSVTNQDALACFQQARALLLFRGWSKKSFSETIDLLRRAIELDPDFAPALAYLALLLAIGGQAYYAADRQAAHDEALEAAERALDLAPQSSEVLGCVGCAFSDIGFHEKGIPIIEKAIEIDATNAQAFAALGAAKIVTLDIENGVKDLEHAIRLSPVNAGSAIWKGTLSIGQMVLGDHTAAYEMAQQACKDDPRYYPGYIAKALVLVQQDRKDKAQSAMDEAQRIFPDLDRTKIRNFMGAWVERTLTEAGIEIPGQESG